MRLALLALALAACASSTSDPAQPAPSVSAAATATPEEVCIQLQKKTRPCGDDYVPALFDVRVRNDRPKGIAARAAAEGRDKLLPIAREEFVKDWSDEAIAAHCKALAQKPPEVQERVVARERACLAETECKAFVACTIGALEARWKADP